MPAPSMARFWTTCAFSTFIALAGVPLAKAAVELPDKSVVKEVDFERHVMGLFGRAGCNNGSCHGSFQGRGGLRLSLFGYDPEKDYAALTRDLLGRRINQIDPDQSQLLLKSTGKNPHEGGQRFSSDSWQYRVLREWIASGAEWKKGSGEVAAIAVNPPEYAFTKPGETGQLQVMAKFANGSQENITPFCDFRINDDSIAQVTSLGELRALQAGDTAVVVSYRGNVIPVRVLVPLETKPGFVYPQIAEVNYADREVFAKLRRLNIVPSELSSDTEFLRRVTIDTIGSLPSPADVRAFLADTDPNKRAKKIDELLAHPLHAALWATKFSDITGNNTVALENPVAMQSKRSQMWHDWFRKRIADNVPYDQIVQGVLTATSRDNQTPEEWIKQQKAIDEAADKSYVTPYAERKSLDLFWRRQQQNVTVDQWGEKTAAAFLGVRLECAQCHKHPFDRWTQVDYRSYANIFTQVTLGSSPTAKKVIDAENAERNKGNTGKTGNNRQVNLVKELFVGPGGKGMQPLPHPETGRSLSPKALGGPVIEVDSSADKRVALFDWMKSPDNPFFARSFVNRVWGHYFGVGIVEPVDDFSLANPPSNDKLLNALAKDFLEHKFDIRHMERLVLNSRAYQLSSSTNETNNLDKNSYAHAYVRPMMAEVVVDVLNSALISSENYGAEAPTNARAIEVGSSKLNNNIAYIFRIFGRPPRTTACDCERAMEPALPQKLFLMTDTGILDKLKKGRMAQLLTSKMSDEQILEELFLATLTRYPNEADKEVFKQYRASKKDPSTYVDTLWALINTREFILNH